MPVPASTPFASVEELSRGLAAGQWTSVELTTHFLDRCRKHGPVLNAVVTLLDKEALAAAEKADAQRRAGQACGPLHGIPFGAKDLLAVPGHPTTWGAAPYQNRVIDAEARVLTQLRQAGAILIAKLSMVEIAGGMGYSSANAAFNGPGRNPWNLDRWSGGSSSGSGSAVAAGLVPFAIGSETWGSITSPAGNCGVTGLRPTYDTVSREGAMALSWTMDKLGPLTRTAHDAELILDVMREPNAHPLQPAPDLQTRKARLAVVRRAADKVQPEVAANFEASLTLLRDFATIEEVELPDLPYNGVADMIIACEAAAAHEELARSGQVAELAHPEDKWRIYPDLLIPAVDYIRAMRVRTVVMRQFGEFLKPFDAVVTPTLATVACPIDVTFSTWGRGFESTQISAASNLAGVPAITVPNGFGADHLPTGLQLVAAADGDHALTALAAEYQSRTTWHKQKPPQFDESAN
jgi:aspartyl-tRNA(Asn)/glutamyl-tRNA(Gln) amidotransferase subunit A